MGRSQREKGKRGEREVAHLWRRHGYWAERTRQSRGDHDPDVRVRGADGEEVEVHVEVKRPARCAALGYLDQAAKDAAVSPFPTLPIVFVRRDGDAEWSAILPAEALLAILEDHPAYGNGLG